MSNLHILPQPSDDEVAAVLAAIELFIDQQEPPLALPQRAAWRAAALLETLGLAAVRGATHVRWSATTRAQREKDWSNGLL